MDTRAAEAGQTSWPITLAERSSRSHGRRTLTRLLEAAVAELDTHGYHGARMARIAKRAGVAHGTLYVYFKDKDDLLAALQKDVDAEVRRVLLAMPAIEAGAGGAGSLRAWATGVVDVFQRRGAVLQALADALASDDDNAAGRAALRSMRATTRHIAERLDQAGAAAPDFDCEMAAICIFALIESGNRALYLHELPAGATGLAIEVARVVQLGALGQLAARG